MDSERFKTEQPAAADVPAAKVSLRKKGLAPVAEDPEVQGGQQEAEQPKVSLLKDDGAAGTANRAKTRNTASGPELQQRKVSLEKGTAVPKAESRTEQSTVSLSKGEPLPSGELEVTSEGSLQNAPSVKLTKAPGGQEGATDGVVPETAQTTSSAEPKQLSRGAGSTSSSGNDASSASSSASGPATPPPKKKRKAWGWVAAGAAAVALGTAIMAGPAAVYSTTPSETQQLLTPSPTAAETRRAAVPTAALSLDAEDSVKGMTFRYNSSWSNEMDPVDESSSRLYLLDLGEDGDLLLALSAYDGDEMAEGLAALQLMDEEERAEAIEALYTSAASGL